MATITRILSNTLALYIASRFVPGFVFLGGIKEFIFAGTALGLLNMTVKPVLKFLSAPLILLTLGFFLIVINGLLLWAVDWFFGFMNIESLISLALATLVVSSVNFLFSATRKVID